MNLILLAKSVFMQAYGGIGLVGFSLTSDLSSDPTQPTLIFSPTATLSQIATIEAAAASFDWTGATTPNLLDFQLAVAGDTTIPVLSLLEFCKFAGVLSQTTPQTIPVLQSLWAAAKASDPLFSGNCTDGTPIVTKIEAYATKFNCSLVAPSQ